jgi:hypothetical protein
MRKSVKKNKRTQKRRTRKTGGGHGNSITLKSLLKDHEKLFMELVKAKKKENADINDAQGLESDEYTVKKTELSENIAKITNSTADHILGLVNKYIDEEQHERKRKSRSRDRSRSRDKEVAVVTPDSPKHDSKSPKNKTPQGYEHIFEETEEERKERRKALRRVLSRRNPQPERQTPNDHQVYLD